MLRKGNCSSEDLLLKNHNVLVLEYVRRIYDEYDITDPLPDAPPHSRLSLTPSAPKTTKKRKMHLMSSQTLKYQSPQPKNKDQ